MALNSLRIEDFDALTGIFNSQGVFGGYAGAIGGAGRGRG